MTIEKIVVRSLIIPPVLSIAACSPYVYKEEVGKFQDGVEQASQLLDSQKEFLSKRSLEISRSDLLDANSPRLVISEGCAEAVTCLEAIAYSTPIGKTCHDQFSASATSDTEADEYKTVYKAAISACGINAKGGLAIEIPIQLPAQRKVLASLDSYAKALVGIVDAEDKKALSESASKACSSTQKLYSTASNIAISSEELSEEDKKKHDAKLEKEGKAVTAVCGLVTETGTAILDQRRLEVLSRVVKESNTKVELLANYLAEESRKVNSIVLRNELEKLSDSVGATVELQGKDEKYLASVDSAVVEKDKFISVLRNNSEGVFLSMAVAHNKLKEALDDPKRQLEAAIGAIENFYKAAKDAHEAVKALSEDEAEK
ncbi:MAG: hypothetical protein P9E88_11520 [Candidatus Competibacter sp.]|jgi:hypothetical protein|nr:hypothetical protein [Candidatus Competibacter sp.]